MRSVRPISQTSAASSPIVKLIVLMQHPARRPLDRHLRVHIGCTADEVLNSIVKRIEVRCDLSWIGGT
jgi:hypothetical protein